MVIIQFNVTFPDTAQIRTDLCKMISSSMSLVQQKIQYRSFRGIRFLAQRPVCIRNGSIDNRNLETEHLKWLGSKSIVFVIKGDFKLFVDSQNWRFVSRSRPTLLKIITDSLFKYINKDRVIRIIWLSKTSKNPYSHKLRKNDIVCGQQFKPVLNDSNVTCDE